MDLEDNNEKKKRGPDQGMHDKGQACHSQAPQAQ